MVMQKQKKLKKIELICKNNGYDPKRDFSLIVNTIFIENPELSIWYKHYYLNILNFVNLVDGRGVSLEIV